jgi:hypothetical protein
MRPTPHPELALNDDEIHDATAQSKTLTPNFLKCALYRKFTAEDRKITCGFRGSAPCRRATESAGSYTMDDFFGLLAFVSLIAAQFLAVVVAYSERFESDLRGGRQCATGTNRGMIPANACAVYSLPVLRTLMFRRYFRAAQS